MHLGDSIITLTGYLCLLRIQYIKGNVSISIFNLMLQRYIQCYIQEWTKQILWKTAFKNFKEICFNRAFS